MAITDATSVESSLNIKAGSAKLKFTAANFRFSTTLPSFQEMKNQIFLKLNLSRKNVLMKQPEALICVVP